jgi:chromosome partitioning protein
MVPDRSAIQQAQGACVPIQDWDTPGAREVCAVFDGLLGRIMRSAGRPAPTYPPPSRDAVFSGFSGGSPTAG